MLKEIKGMPPHVFGIKASGKVTQADMDNVLLPGLDELVTRTGQISYLLVLDTDVQSFTAGAWWKDMIAGLKHFAKWQRIAVVTDQKPVAVFTDLFELAVPGNSKGFTHAQLDEAKAWVAQEKTKPIGPKAHALIDYALVGGLLVLPSLLGMKKKARLIYAAEATVLLPYIALTQQPVAVKGMIPFKTHGKIDPFNIAQFAAQSFLPTFRKDRKALFFNIAFTALAGLTVLLTDYRKAGP